MNTAEIMPGDFTRNADFSLPAERIKRAVTAAAGKDGADFVDATAIAVALIGNAIAANMFMLGYAFQRGRVPLAGDAIRRAIELNGEAVKMNLAAFEWGRRAAAEPARMAELMARFTAPTPVRHLSESLDEVIARRVAFLADYQDEAYAERYRALVARVREAEERTVAERDGADRGRRPRPVQADGLQGRVRGRPPLHGRQLRQADGGDLRGRRATASSSTSPRRFWRGRTRRRACRAR